MATLSGKQSDLAKALADLVELEHDALEAYQAAIARLSDFASKDKFKDFVLDHQRHITELSAAVRSLGVEPPQKGGAKSILTKGKVYLGSLAGDNVILQAMRTNENDTNTAYERAVGRDDVPPPIREILDRNLADERRHRQWIIGRIDQLEGRPASPYPG
jgi:uncharacterized protein (TIGR02284 family)